MLPRGLLLPPLLPAPPLAFTGFCGAVPGLVVVSFRLSLSVPLSLSRGERLGPAPAVILLLLLLLLAIADERRAPGVLLFSSRSLTFVTALAADDFVGDISRLDMLAMWTQSARQECAGLAD